MPALHSRFLLARRPELVAVARTLVTAQARTWGRVLDEDTRGTLELLVSELVTNAVRHATGQLVAVGVRLETGRLRVEVDDDSAEPPVQAANGTLAAWTDESGRGLQLIDALAADHGWKPAGRGKRVWFELPVPAPPRERARAVLPQRAARTVRRGGLARERHRPIPA